MGVENIQARMKIRSKNLQKSVENTWENSNLYFDTSDGEYWDQENVYLSEHHYEEPLDVETAKSLLNFGDDYKQYLESNNSEVQSPRNPECTKKRRTSSKSNVQQNIFVDSCSDDETDGFFTILSDLQKDAKVYEEKYIQLKSTGFENIDNIDNSIESLLRKCDASLKFLENIQTTSNHERNTDIVHRKQDREIRFLVTRWKHLSKQ